MEVICTRNCGNAVENKCRLKELKIDPDGICTNYAKPVEYYREDNVVIYDDAGLPSIMVKFTRPKDAEKVHPMFIIGGEVYDEIFISKYKNCIIDGKAYSLPMQQAATNVTLEEAEKACFSKGEGWHLLTAAERGFLVNYCYDNKMFPHGNTNRGKWHGDEEEKCQTYDGCRMLTGSGPKTWTHDHTIFGVDGLCGDVYEWFRGLRLMNGILEIATNNDAAMNIDLTENSPHWIPVKIRGERVYITTDDGAVRFTTEEPDEKGYGGCRWDQVKVDFEEREILENLGFFPAEVNAYFDADTRTERLPFFGGCWEYTSGAGVSCINLTQIRLKCFGSVGFRSAYYRKRKN